MINSACWVIFCVIFLLLSVDFFQDQLFENPFRNTIRVSNSLDPDQAQHFVRPDLGPNCLQRLSADDSSRQRHEKSYSFLQFSNKQVITLKNSLKITHRYHC